jgi:uncharacterized damage-inducible protein DinB
MTTLSILTTLYDYHYWANAQMIQACEALTLDQWTQPLGHSWESVHGLLTHMLAAETIWLARWQGQSPKTLRQPEEFPTLADIRQAWTQVESKIREFIRQCDDERLSRDLTYTNTQGQTFTLPLGQLILHVANHGTHHRGELAAMLAILQAPHSEDDLLFYFIEQQKSGAQIDTIRKGR